MSGKPPKLTYSKLRLADAWNLSKPVPMKTIAGQLGISINTLYDAIRRRRAYRDCPRAS